MDEHKKHLALYANIMGYYSRDIETLLEVKLDFKTKLRIIWLCVKNRSSYSVEKIWLLQEAMQKTRTHILEHIGYMG